MKQSVGTLRRYQQKADLLIDQAVLVLLGFSAVAYDGLDPKLVERLKGRNWTWIDQRPLVSVALRLLALYRYQPALIDGAAAARLAKRLIATEVAAGGPYHDPSGDDLLLNAVIGQLFTAFGSPLPAVAEFVRRRAARSDALIGDARTEWLLGWPQTLVSSPVSKATGAASPLLKTVIDLTTANSNRQSAIQHRPSKATDNTVATQVHHMLEQLDEPLRPAALSIWQAIIHADTRHEVTQLSDFYSQSLRAVDHALADPLCADLGVNNFYGWMAYTIYDDFLDEEGRPALLPVASAMYRRCLWRYQDLFKLHPSIEPIVTNAFDAMDIANAWEVAHCRFKVKDGVISVGTLPAYGNRYVLAARSAGHLLGPAIITLIGSHATPKQQALIRQGLIHYVIARQLNDDAHDWVEDLSRGHISFAVALLLERAGVQPGDYPLDQLIDRLRLSFWRTDLQALCEVTLDHIRQAQDAFDRSALLQKDNIFWQKVIRPIEQSARQSMAIHADQKKFLQAYQG